MIISNILSISVSLFLFLTHSLTHSLTRSLAHSLARSLSLHSESCFLSLVVFVLCEINNATWDQFKVLSSKGFVRPYCLFLYVYVLFISLLFALLFSSLEKDRYIPVKITI